jgi:hypothetical protein
MSVVRQIRTLEGVVEREAVPKDDSNLCALTKARGRLLVGAAPGRASMFAKLKGEPRGCIGCTRAQLLAYAVGTREFMLEHRHVVTLNRDVVEKFYPLLADIILEVALLCMCCHALRTAS